MLKKFIRILKNISKLIKNCRFLYGYYNNHGVESLTLKQKFYVFHEQNHKELLNFNYSSRNLKNLKHRDSSKLIENIKKFNANSSKISSNYNTTSDNIYTVLYLSLYNLVLNNSAMIKQYKNCSKYSTANKCYYNNIYYPKQTCKDIGNQLLPKRKKASQFMYDIRK